MILACCTLLVGCAPSARCIVPRVREVLSRCISWADHKYPACGEGTSCIATAEHSETDIKPTTLFRDIFLVKHFDVTACQGYSHECCKPQGPNSLQANTPPPSAALQQPDLEDNTVGTVQCQLGINNFIESRLEARACVQSCMKEFASHTVSAVLSTLLLQQAAAACAAESPYTRIVFKELSLMNQQ